MSVVPVFSAIVLTRMLCFWPDYMSILFYSFPQINETTDDTHGDENVLFS